MPLSSRARLSALFASSALFLVQSGAVAQDWSPPLTSPAATQLAQTDGESGEGGEGGEGLPATYELSSTDPTAFDYEATAQIVGYADLVLASYLRAAAQAQLLQSALDAFLAHPTEESLAQARNAWLNARPAYLETEAFRFYDGPIDVDSVTGGSGPEGRLNAWPLNEAAIDYVEGAATAGLVNDLSQEITAETILANDQVTDEADVTTGWHAIEFLLWGQDFSATGPGARPFTDYLPGEGNNDRRRLYLASVTQLLVQDLHGLAEAWAPDQDNYRAQFLALPPREAIGRMMNGLSQLAGFEMPSERLAVALDSGLQEDEHSCFSDNTTFDHIHDLRGIQNVWYGQMDALQVASLHDLLQQRNPALAALVTARLNRAEAALVSLDRPFDQILASAPDSPARAEAEAAVTALTDLAEALQQAGASLGVLVLTGG